MELSKELIYAVGKDAGDRSMRKAGRKVWSRADFTAAAKEFSRLMALFQRGQWRCRMFVSFVERCKEQRRQLQSNPPQLNCRKVLTERRLFTPQEWLLCEEYAVEGWRTSIKNEWPQEKHEAVDWLCDLAISALRIKAKELPGQTGESE